MSEAVQAPSQKIQPKITIVTTPIRPVPSDYPPLGSLGVINALQRAGYESVEFLDIDALRPTYEEVLDHLEKAKPDILGISAVVSTAYEYSKRLSLDIKKRLPGITVILGGNLGACAEILLKKTGIDYVAIGEGEKIIVDFMNAYVTGDRNAFKTAKGLVFLDEEGKLINTGFPDPVAKDDLYDVDWKYLEKYSNINNFIIPAHKAARAGSTFFRDPRAIEDHRVGKNLGTLVSSKGCVARCTFCHRWDRGIRYIPVPTVMKRVKYLMENYNVGYITFADENFGTDKRWLTEFCTEIQKFDILWQVHGMRVNCITPEYLKMMKDAGCSAVYFGMETGSEKILQVMEKKVKIEDNYNCIKWIIDAGIHSTIQLVLGMPGENWSTIKETSDFVNYSNQLDESRDPLDMSINYAQALPGTPLYEYARKKGLIGQTLDEEEKYLLAISDRDASDEATTVNFTDYPRLVTESWRPYIIARAAYHYIQKFGRQVYDDHLIKGKHYFSSDDTGYFNFPKEKVDADNSVALAVDVKHTTETVREKWVPVKVEKGKLPGLVKLISMKKWRVILVRYPIFFYRFRLFFPLMVTGFDLDRNGFRYTLGLIAEYFRYRFQWLWGLAKRARFDYPYKSLRKLVDLDMAPDPTEDPAMTPLRQGR